MKTQIVRGALAAGTLLVMLLGVTSAGFTDDLQIGIGDDGILHGTYDLVFVVDGEHHQGNPEPLEIDTTDLGPVPVVGEGDEPTIAIEAQTTTPEVGGPVTMSVANARPASPAPPADPGFASFADPYDVALFTVTVDGSLKADHVRASQLQGGIPLGPITERTTIAISLALDSPLGNPNYFGRSFFFALTLEGTSR